MEYAESSFKLTRREALALCAHASSDVTRMHLNCVAFDLSTATAVATDGHRLAMVTDSLAAHPLPEAKPTCVSLEKMATAIKMLPNRGALLVTVTGPSTATLTALDRSGNPTTAKIESELPVDFPPYRQILPPVREPAAFPLPTRWGVNAAYLADLALVQAAVQEVKGSTEGLDVQTPTEPGDPIRATCGAWTMVIMPMRIHTEGFSFTSQEKRAIEAWPALLDDARKHGARRPLESVDAPAHAVEATPPAVEAAAPRRRRARKVAPVPAAPNVVALEVVPPPAVAGPSADFEATPDGSFVMLRPLSDAARAWVSSDVEHEPYQWLGDSLACERRYAATIIDAAIAHGFTFTRKEAA